jgi:hypothetical protein
MIRSGLGKIGNDSYGLKFGVDNLIMCYQYVMATARFYIIQPGIPDEIMNNFGISTHRGNPNSLFLLFRAFASSKYPVVGYDCSVTITPILDPHKSRVSDCILRNHMTGTRGFAISMTTDSI